MRLGVEAMPRERTLAQAAVPSPGRERRSAMAFGLASDDLASPLMPTCAELWPQKRRRFPLLPVLRSAAETAAPAREQRKTVTVLFCDVTGSTALGESTDPEALRALLARYFERMKGIVEAHGGTVEKFIGDAVMAVFGVPLVHEDDALRACRAAVEMRDAFCRSSASRPDRRQHRRGRHGHRRAARDRRRGQRCGAAGAGRGAGRGPDRRARRSRSCATRSYAEPVEPLTLKGKARAGSGVPADLGARARPRAAFATPMVGRETELSACATRSTRPCTTARASCSRCSARPAWASRGWRGVPRSVDAARRRGRCLSYGEGITYWPVVEIVKQLARCRRAMPADRCSRCSARPTSAPRRRRSPGRSASCSSSRRRSVRSSCVFDDLHWAEETFLDLVEHVADLSRDAPILLLCMARPELLEKRPAWGGGKLNATTVLLEPLDAAESGAARGRARRRRAGAAPSGSSRPPRATRSSSRRCSRSCATSGDDNVSVPPTIQALLAARLDQLDPAEREVLERGSVEGRRFHRSAVAGARERTSRVTPRLIALVRKDLVRPDKAAVPGRGRLPLPPPADPRRGLRRPAQGGPRRPARALRALARGAWRGSRRARRDPGLPPRAGGALQGRARAAGSRRSPNVPPSGSPPRAAARCGAATIAPRRRCSSARSLSSVRSGFDVHLEVDLAAGSRSRPSTGRGDRDDAAAARGRGRGQCGELLGRVVSARHRLEFEDTVDELDALTRQALPLLEEADDHAGLAHVWIALGEAANHRGDWDETTRGASVPSSMRGGPDSRCSRSAPSGVRFVLGSEPRRALAQARRAVAGSHRTPVSAQPGQASGDARSACGGVAARAAGERATARAHRRRTWRELPRRDRDVGRRRRGRCRLPACLLRPARGASPPEQPLDVRAVFGPLALRPQPLRRGGAARRARPRPRSRARSLHAGALEAGTGARPRLSRTACRGRGARP